jgi:hypothetical protein
MLEYVTALFSALPWFSFFSIYLAVEVGFYGFFHSALVVRANTRTPPSAYRIERSLLLRRILLRLQATSQANGRNDKQVISEFLLQWFRPTNKNDSLFACMQSLQNEYSRVEETSFLDSSSDEDVIVKGAASVLADSSSTLSWTIPELSKTDTDRFLSWAFFGKEVDQLQSLERGELDALYTVIRETCCGLEFSDEPQLATTKHVPRTMTLEDVNPWHRPLLVYIVVAFVQLIVKMALQYIYGFQRRQAASGLVGWYRPASTPPSNNLLPLLFFHGIAPAGLALYLPLVLFLVRDGRAVFLFENRSISCTLGFSALTEDETVSGVQEILKHFCVLGPLALIGHSFGSCPLTWLIREPDFQDRVKQFVLIDPVTILLSEPDVMTNFLYSEQFSTIRMVASSELFTEHYIRRHFSWYNSELWLEDLPLQTEVLIVLSEHDEIVNATKVKQQIDLYCQQASCNRRVQTIYWKNVGHGYCISSPSKWREIKKYMLQSELSLCRRDGSSKES